MKGLRMICIGLLVGAVSAVSFARNTELKAARLSDAEIAYLKKDLEPKHRMYDPKAKMLRTVTGGKHYHSDLDGGVTVHQTRESLEYAVALLKTGDKKLRRRAVDIIRTVVPMQEKDPSLPYCGIWPYYPEDPLRGRTAPADYNWADFIAVPLLDVVISHADVLDKKLRQEIDSALILAARAIMKRDVQPDYTNICIMGTYVCYVVGDFYDQPEIMEYARKRLRNFAEYTRRNNGFTEYNSPTYTVVAMNELLRMKQCIIQPEDSRIIDELYTMTWDMIARHFHRPSGQWCGPNLRSYSSLTLPEVYRLYYNASDGAIELPGDYPRIPNVVSPHKIPECVLPEFSRQDFPRTEVDTFVVADRNQKIIRTLACGKTDTIGAKDIVGKLYTTPVYALASVNQGYMWNQTRPLIAHWGTPSSPSYLQVRFLHDFYDFSAVNIFCAQDSNTVIAVMNVAKDGGDTHVSIDRLQAGRFSARDLRLRIEIGGDLDDVSFTLPEIPTGCVALTSPAVSAHLCVPYAQWGDLKGHWEVGGDGTNTWADFVIYSGAEQTFDLNDIRETVLAFYLSMCSNGETPADCAVTASADADYLTVTNESLRVKALLKSEPELRIRNDFEIND